MEQYNVKFHHGNKFSYSKTAINFTRLSFSWYYSDSDYLVAVQRLKKLIDENCVPINQLVKPNIKFNLMASVKQRNLVYVLGYKGRLGSLIAQKVKSSIEFVYAGGLDRNLNLEYVDSSSIIVDVSSPTGTENLLRKLLEQKIYCKVIIGTTGTLPIDLIEQYSKFAPIAISSNFSKGISQFKKIISVINKDLWKATIVEKHHIMKKDSPSGTAKLLAKYYGQNYIPLELICSVREGEIFGEHHLNLTSSNETIKISHVSTSLELFEFGLLNLIKWFENKTSGLYEDIDYTQNVFSGKKKNIVTRCMSEQFKDILSVIDNSWRVESQYILDNTTTYSTVILSNDYEYIKIQHESKNQEKD
jgi:4-hydroxy-tetrahydrodipicolinate reductase